MPWFQFLIRGENYLLKSDNGVKNMGFYTTRFFKAENVEEAEKKAGENIRNDKGLNSALVRTHALNPEFFFEEIYELEGKPPKIGIWPFRRNQGGGLILYNMDEE